MARPSSSSTREAFTLVVDLRQQDSATLVEAINTGLEPPNGLGRPGHRGGDEAFDVAGELDVNGVGAIARQHAAKGRK